MLTQKSSFRDGGRGPDRRRPAALRRRARPRSSRGGDAAQAQPLIRAATGRQRARKDGPPASGRGRPGGPIGSDSDWPMDARRGVSGGRLGGRVLVQEPKYSARCKRTLKLCRESAGRLGSPSGQADGEPAPPAGERPASTPPPWDVGDRLDDRQPEAGAGVGGEVGRAAAADEAGEDLLRRRRRGARGRRRRPRAPPRRRAPTRDRRPSVPGGRVADAVLEQVEDQAVELVGVALDRHRRRRLETAAGGRRRPARPRRARPRRSRPGRTRAAGRRARRRRGRAAAGRRPAGASAARSAAPRRRSPPRRRRRRGLVEARLEQLEVGEDAGQRRAQLVRGVGDEVALAPASSARSPSAPRRARAASGRASARARRPRRRSRARACAATGRGSRRSRARRRSATAIGRIARPATASPASAASTVPPRTPTARKSQSRSIVASSVVVVARVLDVDGLGAPSSWSGPARAATS